MTHPRGSAAQVNEIVREAVERGKAIIDEMAQAAGASGYAALTEPVTLKDLLAMEPEEAVLMLRQELRRTTETIDGEPVVDPKTIDLIAQYMRRQSDGDATDRL